MVIRYFPIAIPVYGTLIEYVGLVNVQVSEIRGGPYYLVLVSII